MTTRYEAGWSTTELLFLVTPEQALILEDANAGVLAGQASGCDVVAVRRAFNGKNDLS